MFIASADETGKQDGYLIASSSESISSVSPCLTQSDYFVSSAAKTIYWRYDHSFSGVTDAILRDNTIVLPAVSSLTTGLLNVISLGRGQLYSKIDRMCDFLFSFALIGLSAFMWLNHMQHERRKSRIEDYEAHSSVGNTEADKHVQTMTELEVTYAKIINEVQPQVHILEGSIRSKIRDKNPSYHSAAVETAVTVEMRSLAADFMNDSEDGRDATTQIKLLLMPYAICHKLWGWIRTGLHSTVFNTAAVGLVVFELACDGQGWDESTLYSIQGVLVLLLGFDAIINAVLEFTAASPASGGSKPIFSTETYINVCVVPALWLLLSIACSSSRHYYCSNQLCMAKHYLYPLLFILRNHALWMSLVAFAKSMISAGVVLLLFLCFIMTMAAIGTMMLQGVYDDSVFYELNQYFDFSTTFITMFIMVEGGDNYVEAASIGFRESIWYSLFFVLCTVIGLFFITSLLIEAFCGSYEDDQLCCFRLRKRNERRSLVAVMLIWSRHSYHSAAVHGKHRNIVPSMQYLEYTQEGLVLDAFMDLIQRDAFNLAKTQEVQLY